jgi:lambda family phage minor tail protein L
MDSSILQEITSPDPSTLVVLFEIKLKDEDDNSIGSYRFHAGENGFETSINFKNNEYLYLPVEANGFDATDESLPRPTIKFDNTDGFFSLKTNLFRDFVGFEVIRTKTFVKFLHQSNFPNETNPYGSGTEAAYPDEEYVVNAKTMENSNYVQFELVSKLEKEGGIVPGRKVVYNVCQWKYRSEHGCGYNGTTLLDEKDNELGSGASAAIYNKNTSYSVGSVVFIETDNNGETIKHYFVCIQAAQNKNPLTQPLYWTKDNCSKSLFGCRKRFGNQEFSSSSNAGLPFGAFPGSWKS